MKTGEERESYGSSEQHSQRQHQRYSSRQRSPLSSFFVVNVHIQFWELPTETGIQQHHSRGTSLEREIGFEQSRDVTVEQPELNELEDEGDFVEEEFIDEGVEDKVEPQSVFPEAIPGGPALLQHSTRSEITPAALVNVGGVRDGGYMMTTIPSESR